VRGGNESERIKGRKRVGVGRIVVGGGEGEGGGRRRGGGGKRGEGVVSGWRGVGWAGNWLYRGRTEGRKEEATCREGNERAKEGIKGVNDGSGTMDRRRKGERELREEGEEGGKGGRGGSRS